MSDGNQGVDPALMMALGQIQGELSGIRSQIAESNQATNTRIDDLAESVRQQTDALNRRIDDHQQDTHARFETIEQRIQNVEGEQSGSRRATLVTSGGVSTVIAVSSEVIKAVIAS